jgi:hypothetical protein
MIFSENRFPLFRIMLWALRASLVELVETMARKSGRV